MGDPVVDTHQVLAELGIRHVFAGSLALLYYGRARGTRDIDVVVHARREKFPEILDALRRRGATVDSERFLRELDERGYAGVPMPAGPRAAPFVVELISPQTDFDVAVLGRAKRRTYASMFDSDAPPTKIPIVSPEDFLVWKLVFWRDKDRPDIQSVLISRVPVDLAAVRERLSGLLDPEDEWLSERFTWWDEQVARLRPPPPPRDGKRAKR